MNHIIGTLDNPDNGNSPISILKDIIKTHGGKVRLTHDWISILGYAAIDSSSIVWVDWDLIKNDYLQFHRKLEKINNTMPIIIFSRGKGIPLSVIKHHTLIFNILKYDELGSKTNELLARLGQYTSLRKSVSLEGGKSLRPGGFGLFSGNSVNMLDLYRQIDKVAPSNFSVLIKGQSGSGKELVAKTVHDLSQRKEMGFVTINCAAIPENLLESELFGYEKGAFTDAKTSKAGKFEQANHGTMFLDEIGDMPHQLQVKLLRVLNDNIVQRIGANDSGKKVDVRFISATHQDLDEMISLSTFRHDLYHRINVIPVSIDPLMSREDDLQLIILDLMTELTEEADVKVRLIDWSFIDRLSRIELKGNIRELKNILTRAIFEVNDGQLNGAILEYILGDRTTLAPDTVEENVSPLWQVEKDAIGRALIIFDYNISEVSRQLDISRASLYRKMGKYNLERKD